MADRPAIRTPSDRATSDWSDAENGLIVADYFAMLANDFTGQSYSKAEHNRRLQERIGRSRGSIEFKRRNISAVLQGLGETSLIGYRPAFNFQASLETAVAGWLAKKASLKRHRRERDMCLKRWSQFKGLRLTGEVPDPQ